MVAGEGAWLDAAMYALIEAMDEAVIVFDARMRCRAMGRRTRELFGIDPEEARGASRLDIVQRMAAACADPEHVLASVGGAALSLESTVTDPVEVVRPRARTIAWTTVPIVEGGAVAGRIDILRDVTRERRAERASEDLARRLEEVATVDTVTGLPNRRRFEQESEREHRRAQRAWESYAVVRVDVDGMARINAAHGTEVGDLLLKKIGEELRAGRREYDVVARWDGDEFALLLPRTDAAAARTVTKRAVRAFREKVLEVGPGLRVSVCAGAAVWTPPSGELADDIVRRAANALASARETGPGSYEVDADLPEWKDEPTEG